MSVFAGIISTNKERHLRDSEKHALTSLFKTDDKRPYTYAADERFCCAHLSSNALTKDPGIIHTTSSVTLLAGQLHVDHRELRINPENVPDVTLLHKDWDMLGPRLLKYANGTFCFAHLNTADSNTVLTLASDKLGVRSLYYCVRNDLVVFSTAIRILEELPFLSKKLDIIGISEVVALGYPLADRTQYSEINTLREAEVIEFSHKKTRRTHYWQWDQVPIIEAPKKELIREAHKRFNSAVRVRITEDAHVVTYLSGGMDSRAIVGAIHEIGATPCAFTFSPEGSQDAEFARAFAEKIGCNLLFKHRPTMESQCFPLELIKELQFAIDQSGLRFERPRAVWSGDGGSVGVGAVYLNSNMVQAARADSSRKNAARKFMAFNKCGLPLAFYTKRARLVLKDTIEVGITAELERLNCDDPAQALYLFLMLNDQRRHLRSIYEHMNEHGVEYHLPFFDGSFLEWIVGIPIDYRLCHKFYTDWFKAFPNAVHSTPWQTYPGHVACPIESVGSFSYQWDVPRGANVYERIARRMSLVHRVLVLLKANSGLFQLLSPSRLMLATVLHSVGVDDYEYAVKAAETYAHYITQGDISV